MFIINFKKNALNYLIIFIILIGICTSINAEMLYIDFDDLNANDIVIDQYRPKGVTFSLLNTPWNHIKFPRAIIPPHQYDGAKGLVITSRQTNLSKDYYDIEIHFYDDVDYFSILSLDSDEPLFVRCYYEGSLVYIRYYRVISDRGVHNIKIGKIGGTRIFDNVEIDVVDNTITGDKGGPEFFDELIFNTVKPDFCIGYYDQDRIKCYIKKGFKQILEREPSETEYNYYLNKFNSDCWTAKKLVKTLVRSPEHFAKYFTGSLPYVKILFRHLLARNAENAGLKNWANYLDSNAGRGWKHACNLVAKHIYNSNEYNTNFGDHNFPGIDCSICENHSFTDCYDGHIYWFNSCNEVEDIYKICDNGCKNGECIECESHSYTDCHDGNIYWFNSCNEVEDIYKICDNSCKNGECIECESHSYTDCHDENIYWFNSCNEVEDIYKHCENGCENGECNPSEIVCPEATITCGIIASGSIDTIDEIDEYTFCAKKYETIAIGIEGFNDGNMNFKPHWQLYNSLGGKIKAPSSDYSERTIEMDGIHIIRVYDYPMDSTGKYKIKLESISSELNGKPGCFKPIKCGNPIEDSIDMKHSTTSYSFSAKKDDIIAIGIEGFNDGNMNFKPHWQLYNSLGGKIKAPSSDYSERTIEMDGIHIIRVYDYPMDSTGKYKIKLECLSSDN